MRNVLQSLCSEPGRILLPGGVRRNSSVVLVLSPPADAPVSETAAAGAPVSDGPTANAPVSETAAADAPVSVEPTAAATAAESPAAISAQLPELPADQDNFGMEGWRVWLQKRAEHISQGGDVCLPGGRIEAGESGAGAALREWEEEMGVPKATLDLLGCFGTHVHFSGQTVQVWLAIGPAMLEADLRPNDEVARVLSPTLGQLVSARWTKKQMSLEIVPLPKTAGPPSQAFGSANARWIAREFPVFYVDGLGEMLWGMTASILGEFLRKLYEKKAISRLPEGL